MPEQAPLTGFAALAMGQRSPEPEQQPNLTGFAATALNPVAGYLRDRAQHRRPWDEVEPDIRQSFPGLDPSQLERDYRMQKARDEFQGGEEGLGRRIARRSVPFYSTGFTLGESLREGRAKQRIAGGTASDQDYRDVAAMERLREVQSGRGLGGKLADAALSVPGVLGEMAAAGPAIGGMTSSFAGRAAVTPLLVPSMGLYTGAAERADKSGRSPFDPSSILPAYGHSALSAAVLGSLQKFGNGVPTAVGRAATKGVIGTGEQAGADVLTGLADEVLAEPYQAKTRYGILGKLADRKAGEALSDATVTAFTFALFAAAHGQPHRPVLDNYQSALDHLARNGYSKESAGRYLGQINDRLDKAYEQNPNLTRGEGRAIFEGLPKGPLRDYAHSLADTLQETAQPERGRPTSQPVEAQAEQPARPESGAAQTEPASGFRTAKGSTYELHDDGTTTRNKAERDLPGHEGDKGIKPRTARTVYVPTKIASALSSAGLSGVGAKGARLLVKDGQATLVTWNEKEGRWGATASGRNVAVSDRPAVGLSPLELWDRRGDVPGHPDAYAKQHAGSAITELFATKPAPSSQSEPSELSKRNSSSVLPQPATPPERITAPQTADRSVEERTTVPVEESAPARDVAPQKVKAAGEGGEYFQDAQSFYKVPENPAHVRSEPAAARAAALLGVHVLPTEVGDVAGQPAVKSPLLGEHKPIDKTDTAMPPEQVARVGLANWLTHAADRNPRNYVVRPGDPRPIALDYAESWHPDTFRDRNAPVGPYTDEAVKEFGGGKVPLSHDLIREALAKQGEFETLAAEGTTGLGAKAQGEALGLLRQKFNVLRSLLLRRESTLSNLPTFKGLTPDEPGSVPALSAVERQRLAQGRIGADLLKPRPGPTERRAPRPEPVTRPEPLTPAEVRAEREFAQVRYDDIPADLRERAERITTQLASEQVNAEGLRETYRSAFAGGGEEGLRVLLEYQETRLRPATAGELERAEWDLKQAEADDAVLISEADALRINREILERRLRQAAETAAGAVPGGRTTPTTAGAVPSEPARTSKAVTTPKKRGSELRKKKEPQAPESDAQREVRELLDIARTNAPDESSADYRIELAFRYADATSPEVRKLLRPYLEKAGLTPTAEEGQVVPFDGRLQRTDADVMPGDPVRITRAGWRYQTEHGGVRHTLALAEDARPSTPEPTPDPHATERARLSGVLDRYETQLKSAKEELERAFPSVAKTGKRPEFAEGYDRRLNVVKEYEAFIAETKQRLKELGATPTPEPAKPAKGKKGAEYRTDRPGKSLVDAVIRFGGIDPDSIEFKKHFRSVGEARKNEPSLRRPGLFKRGGRGLDQMAQELHATRHIPDADPQTLIDMLLNRKESMHEADSQAKAAQAVEEADRRKHATATDLFGRPIPKKFTGKKGTQVTIEDALREAWTQKAKEWASENGVTIEQWSSSGKFKANGEWFEVGPGDEGYPVRKAGEQVDRGEADDSGMEYTPSEVAPGVMFSPPSGAAASTSATPPGKPTGPFEIIRTAEELLGPKRYVEKRVPHSRTAAAAYLQDPRAIVAGRMHAGDAAVDIHERAHDIATEYKLEANPALLPADVRHGFKAFDYDPRRPMGRTAIMEGFAEYVRRRSTDQLVNLTPDQQAAAKYAEDFIQTAGLTEKLDRLREMFRRLESSSPEQQAAGLVSATGRPVNPEQTPGERARSVASELANRLEDDVDNDLGVLRRMTEDARRRGTNLRIGQDPYTVYSQLMFADRARAGEFERDGVHTIENGQKVVIGQSLDRITEGAKPEWLAQSLDGGPSRAGLYALTRHVLGEVARGAKPIPDEQLATYQRAWAEFQADKAFVAWAEPFAERLTRAFNDTRRALASPDIHLLTPNAVDALEKARPDYVPLERVVSDKGWKVSQGTRGEKMAPILHGRSGSGEQIVDPLGSLKKRYLVTAALMGEQLKRNAVANLLTQPGMGRWGVVAGDQVGLTEAGKVQADKLRNLGVSEENLRDILQGVGSNLGTHYFTYRPWPSDGSKPTWFWVGPEGKTIAFRIGDRALYDLITGQQVDAHQTARVIHGIAHFGFEVPGVGRVEPIRAATQLLKTGATTASLGFHIRNIPRDVYTFWSNTIDRASVGQLPDAFRRAYAFAWSQLTGKVSGDVLFKKFHDFRGDQLRQFAFDRSDPTTAYSKANAAARPQAIQTAASLWGVAKDLLGVAGAGELAPRFQEFKTRLTQTTGLTEAQLAEKFGAAEMAAADGSPYREPVPFHLLLDAMNHAAEVTVNFSRQGTVTREVNKITPFFGPAISGLSKALRNWRTNPKGAAFALSATLALRALHWALFHDEQWYQELGENDRFNNFVVPTPAGLRRLPGPRGLEVPGGGFLITMLDAAAGKNPDVKGLVRQSFEAVGPPAPVPPVAKVAWELQGNEGWTGSPIVPRRDEQAPALHKLLNYQLPYAAQQLTGGRGEPSLRGLGVVPFTEVRNARRSVDEYYARLQALEGERALAQRQGQRFDREAEYQKLHAIERQMQTLGRELRGEGLVGGKTVKLRKEPGEERKTQLRQQQLDLARRVLGR